MSIMKAINFIEPISFFIGMIFCMILDILSTIANYYVTKALLIRKCKKCEFKNECQNSENYVDICKIL